MAIHTRTTTAWQYAMVSRNTTAARIPPSCAQHYYYSLLTTEVDVAHLVSLPREGDASTGADDHLVAAAFVDGWGEVHACDRARRG